MTIAFIGLGSNLGDRLENIACALGSTDRIPATRVEAVSHVYESEPWAVEDQPPFANAVARVRTELRADELLDALQDIERECGREPGGIRFGPRVIDIDILLFGDEEWASERLTIPHPRMDERQFVMVPMAEVGADASYPDGEPVCGEGWVGRITAELGVVPGFSDRTPSDTPERFCDADVPVVRLDAGEHPRPPRQGGEPGAAPAPYVPGPDDEPWDVVADLLPAGRADGVPDFAIHFEAMVLDQEGIPFVWDPAPPEENYSPWGLSQRVRLRVPRRYADHARKVLAEAMSAPPEFEE